MYIVTFYSFKGGVGRTLALVNVGVELARTGKRVLLVDFDLEAPGIDTFAKLKPRNSSPGIVEYTATFIQTRVAPDVRDYVYEAAGVAQNGGRLFIMPAGRGDDAYAQNLASINWQHLYKDLDGYLMFEDLKSQWNEAFSPDYVLIDSRTGHTDVEGICTRQLPDAVVLLFFPNEQNLAGLKKVVSLIRGESKPPKNHEITTHFVMSNVPDLDDEDLILEERVDAFKAGLGYSDLAATIHRYDSLALLNQVIFCAERPRSRLAKEYRNVKDAIVGQNLSDRQGALFFLKKLRRRQGRTLVAHRRTKMSIELDAVLKLHRHDGEVLYNLALCYERLGQNEQALALLNDAIEAGYKNPDAFLERAEVRRLTAAEAGTLDDVKSALQFTELDAYEVCRAIQLIRQVDPNALSEITDFPATQNLKVSETFVIANELTWSRQGMLPAVKLCRRVENDASITVQLRDLIVNQIMLCLIGAGHFQQAMGVVGRARPSPEDLWINQAFNYAMAEWAHSGKPPLDLFQQVYIRHSTAAEPSNNSANYSQCLAIVCAMLKKKEEAFQFLQEALDKIKDQTSEFTSWRYLTVTTREFREDCQGISRLIAGDNIRPLMFSNAESHSDLFGSEEDD